MFKSLRFNLLYLAQSVGAMYLVYIPYLLVAILTGTWDRVAGMLYGMTLAFVVFMPLIIMLTLVSNMVMIALSMGQKRAQLFWDLQLCNVVYALGTAVFTVTALLFSNAISAEGVPLTLKIVALSVAISMVMGALGLFMGLCMLRWGGWGIFAALMLDAIFLVGMIVALVMRPVLFAEAITFVFSAGTTLLQLGTILGVGVVLTALVGGVCHPLIRKAAI